eukprot:TRINITY_DN42205_c0_g1_i1.p3 TRINITY_DN42205_c0_g1~~TRINITY_DN42205_c0_g1_i1.p3  ORF type:complete len:176 (+),score=49.39 TRINITY_DN42205_c0_g1_i1:61-528(+)
MRAPRAAPLLLCTRGRAARPRRGCASPPQRPPPASESPYAMLGLDPGADEAAVRARYHELARRHHPDRPGGDAARMRALNEAVQRIAAARRPGSRAAQLFRGCGGRWWQAAAPQPGSLEEAEEMAAREAAFWRALGLLAFSALAAAAAYEHGAAR